MILKVKLGPEDPLLCPPLRGGCVLIGGRCHPNRQVATASLLSSLHSLRLRDVRESILAPAHPRGLMDVVLSSVHKETKQTSLFGCA